jgi:tetratricopeptide (TPR) repeat protein
MIALAIEFLCLIGIGDAYFGSEQWETAIDYYEKGRVIASNLESKEDEASCLESIGDCLVSLERLPEAIEKYQAAIELAKAAENVLHTSPI